MRFLFCAIGFAFSLFPPAPSLAQEGLENEIKDIDWVGFQQFEEVSRVFVRTTEPVKYKLETDKPGQVVLILHNTRVPLRNNLRHLDTRFFEGPVTFIQPRVIEGPSPSVRIEIRLRSKAPFKEIQNDNILALDFPRQ